MSSDYKMDDLVYREMDIGTILRKISELEHPCSVFLVYVLCSADCRVVNFRSFFDIGRGIQIRKYFF